MMKKFSGNRPREEVKAACLANGWRWDDQRFLAGSDYTTFHFVFEKRLIVVVWCSFNGRFIARRRGEIVSETSAHMDGVPWYNALLDFIYKPRAA